MNRFVCGFVVLNALLHGGRCTLPGSTTPAPHPALPPLQLFAPLPPLPPLPAFPPLPGMASPAPPVIIFAQPPPPPGNNINVPVNNAVNIAMPTSLTAQVPTAAKDPVPVTIPAVPGNVQGANALPNRLKAEAFCNDKASKTLGAPLLKSFIGKYGWSFAPQTGVCQRAQLLVDGTTHFIVDTNRLVQGSYILENGVVYRDLPAQWRCASVSTEFLPLTSSPDNNLVLQVECVPAGYEYHLFIREFNKITPANRAELTDNFGFDLSAMDLACANLPAPLF